MRTFRILLTVAIAMLMTAPLSAQQNQKKKGAAGQLSAPARALARIDKLHKSMEGMELNDEQKAAVAKIHEEIGPQMKKALTRSRKSSPRNNKRLSRKQSRRQRMRARKAGRSSGQSTWLSSRPTLRKKRWTKWARN